LIFNLFSPFFLSFLFISDGKLILKEG
jgi:hypothetical protein